MRKLYKVNVDLRMESRHQFNINFDKRYDDIYDVINVPDSSSTVV